MLVTPGSERVNNALRFLCVIINGLKNKNNGGSNYNSLESTLLVVLHVIYVVPLFSSYCADNCVTVA